MTFRTKGFVLGLLVAVLGVVVTSYTSVVRAQDTTCGEGKICSVESALSLKTQLYKARPNIDTPSWLKSIHTFTYSIETRGNITIDINEFKTQVNETLNDSRGWTRLGVRYKEVASGGDVVIFLSEASKLPTFSAGCTSYYSCTVGDYVIVNQTRWLGATEPWNASGGNLRDYRHMVVNHEMGHWLGHSHTNCGGTGQLAPLMQQQSSGLYGCKFNPWPLDSELWSTKL